MAVIITGKKLTIEVATVAYSAQVTSASLVPNQSQSQGETLTTTIPYNQTTSFQLQVDGFQDWGEAVSFCDAMWTAAATGTAIAFELVVDGPTADRTFTGNILPKYISAGGSASDALAFSQTFEVVGIPTKV